MPPRLSVSVSARPRFRLASACYHFPWAAYHYSTSFEFFAMKLASMDFSYLWRFLDRVYLSSSLYTPPPI
ncbi:hypothetical protein BYT27DRAFT_7185419 [Phlegmacium glaucopus]|nr:hypothetical protein BYT27DRAFT_7190272 [Phlegmacium glaucopus]KAF8810872.1 hypothetical protein BYT27DRAFT_7185419 [Phlegmacium glaucopus]